MYSAYILHRPVCWLRADQMQTVAASHGFSAPLSLSVLNLPLLAPLLSIAVSPELHVLSLSVSSPLLTAVCALPEYSFHTSFRCLLMSSPALSLSIAVNPPALSLTLLACPSQSLS